MKFVELEADNFKSFEHFRIDLDGHGFVKIDGVNNTDEYSESVGSGKSTIADALSYALTGETVKGNSSMSDVKNMYTKGDCRVSVVFEHRGSTYQIIRGEGGLQLIEDGKDISKHLKRETQELIMQKFPFFTPTFIGATVIIGQNMPNAFTNNKPSARKAILEELTNSSFMIEDIKNRLAERKQEWQSALSDINTSLVRLETNRQATVLTKLKAESALESLGDASEIQEELEGLAELQEKYAQELSATQAAVDGFQADCDSLSKTVKGLEESLSDFRLKHQDELVRGLEGLHSKKSEAEAKLAELRSIYSAKSAESTRLQRQINELKNAPTHCPTCGQPLPNAHKIDTSKQEAELAALVAECERLGEQATPFEKAIDDVIRQISEYRTENATTPDIERTSVLLRSNRALLDEKREALASMNKELAAVNKDIAEASNKEVSLRSRLHELSTQIGRAHV